MRSMTTGSGGGVPSSICTLPDKNMERFWMSGVEVGCVLGLGAVVVEGVGRLPTTPPPPAVPPAPGFWHLAGCSRRAIPTDSPIAMRSPVLLVIENLPLSLPHYGTGPPWAHESSHVNLRGSDVVS